MTPELANGNYIITGMSGTGKTTLLRGLKNTGFNCFDEPARKILEYHSETDGPALPAKDPYAFVKEMLDQNVRDIQEASVLKKPAFFDRGIPDTVAYAIRFNVESAEFEKLAKQTRYNQHVFLMPPWKEIFKSDPFRQASFEQYIDFHKLIKQVYLTLDYTLIEVPLTSLQHRIKFVLAHIENNHG